MKNQSTELAQGNAAVRNRQFRQAIPHYIESLIGRHAPSKTIAGNIALARNKYRARRATEARLQVAVCGWVRSHCAAGRVRTLAELYKPFADVEIIGTLFPSHGRKIWPSIRGIDTPIHSVLVEDESRFLNQALQLVAAHPYDLVHLCRPRLPNILMGLLYKQIWGAQILIDVDDEELDFVASRTPIRLDNYLRQHDHLPPLKDLQGTNWTRLAVGLANAFDGVTTVNYTLQQRYGGHVVRHARNEADYQPITPQRKQAIRAKYDIVQDKKVVLFLGTPHAYNDLVETAQAITSLKRQDIALAIVGDSLDLSLTRRLRAIPGVEYAFIDNHPGQAALEVSAMGDASVLLQDPQSSAAWYQTPAWLSDALAIGLPVLATETPALADAFIDGALLPVTPDTLPQQLARVLDDANTAEQLRQKGLAYFQRELSFSANAPRLQQSVRQSDNRPLANDVEALVRHIGDEPLISLLQIAKSKAYACRQPAAHPEALPMQKVAVAAHVYYPELWPEIARRLKGLTTPFDLFITTPPPQSNAVTVAVKADFLEARIDVQPNQGMDIVPFLHLVPTLVKEGYLAVCKVHTKKGEGEQGRLWRDGMLDALIGDSATFADVAAAFAREPSLQLAGPASLYLSAQKTMPDSVADLDALLQKLEGRSLHGVDWGFFSGAMFWVRPSLLEKLARYIVQNVDQLEIDYQKDGLPVHSVERLFGLLPALQHGQVGLLHPSLLSPSGETARQKSHICSSLADKGGNNGGTTAPPLEEAEKNTRYSLQLAPAATQPGQAQIGDLLRQFAHLVEDRKTLNDSGLFDTAHYSAQCPSLDGKNVDLASHYLLIGGFQGKTPNPDFAPAFYATQYANQLSAGENPFLHYLRQGAKAGLLLRPTKEQEEEEIPNFRHRALNTTLIDWNGLANQGRNAERVSVIIPVYNNPETSRACIESLYQHTEIDRFELIVVDNGSDAPTRETVDHLASQHINLRVVRNKENLNFALACNLGFAQSRGEQVIFLQNDTTVTANWLEPLLQPLDRTEISAVQPRLLNPDGTIQCMGIVFSEKSPIGYSIYAGMQPEESWAGRSRSFHAVTGACMAIRATDFAHARGFDPVYINGQEDVDLCLRLNLRSHYRGWYAAEATVYHHEGQSRYRDRFIHFNRRAFSQRWAGQVQPDDETHYLQDGFVVKNYQPDAEEVGRQAISAWYPTIKHISQIDLERPASLEPYYFDLIKQSGLFDIKWYLQQYQGRHKINGNALAHYLEFGLRDGLNPSPAFDTKYYVESNPDLVQSDLHPFVHYVAQGCREGREPLPPPPPEYVPKYSVSEPEYIPRLSPDAPPVEKAVRVIAFYLPQFHAILENDEWWGKGFTEWTNVKPAEPQFEGHYQPHVPDDFLGYYNLLDLGIQVKQIELAKQYGVEGFCFYLYWFTGHRLLEQPVDNYLNDPTLDLPFCVCWANENWSRRWDGRDSELLMEQHYSDEDDLEFIANTAKYLQDLRYIRINGKPLLLVYRPNLFPSMRATARRWRDWCRANGIGEIYLVYPQSFESVDPAEYGFDAACEFPPNNSSPPEITHKVKPIVEEFQSVVYDWRIFVDRSKAYQEHGYTLFRTATPSWDNTARRKNKGTVFHNSCPKLFERWLTNAFVDTLQRHDNPDEQIVFVNAWNEWAECAHLEPDQRYGYASLQAVRQAHKAALAKRRRIVVVSHDAHPHGAQILCLNFARYFKDQFNFDVDVIVLGEGLLISKYAEYAHVYPLNLATAEMQDVERLVASLRSKGAEVAIVNTTVSGKLVPYLKAAGFSVVSLVHEMPGILNAYGLQEHVRCIADMADRVVFAAEQVRQGFETFLGRPLTQAVIRPQGLYLRSLLRAGADKNATRAAVRSKLGVPEAARIIMCAGYADHRKGFDLFVKACLQVMEQVPDTYALWVGHLDQAFVDKSLEVAEMAGRKEQFLFSGLVDHPQEYYLAADVYALTSREDPFPSVVMEALDALTPVVAFKGCGGFENLLQRDCGVLVPGEDCMAYAQAIKDLLHTPDRARRLAHNGQQIVETELSFRHYLFDLLEFSRHPLHKVSVVVPNYNYECYIRPRLESLVNQTYPIYELIVLDDKSQDNSVAVIQDFLRGTEVPHRLIVNEQNSGSVIKQWHKGVQLARGDLVWIAEADDLAEPQFVNGLVGFFDDAQVVLAFSQSKQIDEKGKLLANDYLEYTKDVGDFWCDDYVIDGEDEIKRALCIKNIIPNVSAVLLQRAAVNNALSTHSHGLTQYKVAGDWMLYLYLAMTGKLAFKATALNLHRRHSHSVTKVINHLDEVVKAHEFIASKIYLDDCAKGIMREYEIYLSKYFQDAAFSGPPA